MSNNGPAPRENKNSGFGWKMSGPMYWITVCADSGSTDVTAGNGPPGGLHARAEDGVRRHPDQQTRLLGLHEQVASALARSTLIGFSVHTCLPAAIAFDATSACTAGMVRFTTTSTSGWLQHVVGGAPLSDAVLLGPGLGRVDVQVTEDDHVDVGEPGQVLQVGVADHAGADETDTHRSSSCHQDLLLSLVSGRWTWTCRV